jgi:hypothetical protein
MEQLWYRYVIGSVVRSNRLLGSTNDVVRAGPVY